MGTSLSLSWRLVPKLTILDRPFHLSSNSSAGGLFRAKRRLPVSNNEWGPLTDLPDFSIIGKPNPRFTSEGQRRRAIRNYKYASDIMRLSNEISETKYKFVEEKWQKEAFHRKAEEGCLKSKGSFSKNFQRVQSDSLPNSD
ncbi:39S ribosomal protein L52 [Paragonimus heterotremus]|uniref:Large ribosomal subunit protein mL52 n=1 Tax=Paragonimus heterotremus TaxID=100268 RepID=A0A8J4WVK8_9TREM|nr:39S ribosomal protein L52 [Paragonimus heterotremus]